PHEERIICDRCCRTNVVFHFQQLLCQRWRICVGHLHKGGSTTRHCGVSLGSNGCLVGKPRLAEMHLVVYNTRYEVKTFPVNLEAVTGRLYVVINTVY